MSAIKKIHSFVDFTYRIALLAKATTYFSISFFFFSRLSPPTLESERVNSADDNPPPPSLCYPYRIRIG